MVKIDCAEFQHSHEIAQLIIERRKFSAEFMNRIDKMVVFQPRERARYAVG